MQSSQSKRFKLVAAISPILMMLATPVTADPIIVIKPGIDYKKYDNQELRRRIHHLEEAVFQLQQKVFALELKGQQAVEIVPEKKFTCYIRSFGKTFKATSSSEMEARATVIEKCSAASNAIHCGEDDVKCGE